MLWIMLCILIIGYLSVSTSSIEQDTSITVAFEDIPEEGLNSPLRLEKVANEVYHLFYLIIGFYFMHPEEDILRHWCYVGNIS